MSFIEFSVNIKCLFCVLPSRFSLVIKMPDNCYINVGNLYTDLVDFYIFPRIVMIKYFEKQKIPLKIGVSLIQYQIDLKFIMFTSNK